MKVSFNISFVNLTAIYYHTHIGHEYEVITHDVQLT